MSVTAHPIAADVLDHLDAQLGSARRLLAQILRQSGAIRRRDVDAVLATMTDIQGEMASRGRLESERTDLLWRAGNVLGVAPEAVTLGELTSLMDPRDAGDASARSAELRGLLSEIEREHAINRALMRQELSFLEHLTRMLGGGAEHGGYSPPGRGTASDCARTPTASRAALRVLDLEA
ncbi:MAG TPA: flagellar export chaperone FlgN [Solirubrobacteraceae bacterium]|nr:flagellar export chaperone FlgN [Solirubrobacteraceae bacterium]